MMEFNDIPPTPTLLEHTISEISKEEVIVVGVEYFFMPKYKGMRLIKLAASAFITNWNAPSPIIDKVSVS